MRGNLGRKLKVICMELDGILYRELIQSKWSEPFLNIYLEHEMILKIIDPSISVLDPTCIQSSAIFDSEIWLNWTRDGWCVLKVIQKEGIGKTPKN